MKLRRVKWRLDRRYRDWWWLIQVAASPYRELKVSGDSSFVPREGVVGVVEGFRFYTTAMRS